MIGPIKVPAVVIDRLMPWIVAKCPGAEIIGAYRFLQRRETAVGKRINDHARRKDQRLRRLAHQQNRKAQSQQ